jgi:phosphonate transport system substrate-binding protein
MNRLFSALSVIAVLGFLLLVNFWVLSDLQDIGNSYPMPEGRDPAPPDQGREVVRIGVISRFAPNIIYQGYQPILDYLNQNGSYIYELRLSTSYQDAVDRLVSGEVAASFLGAWLTSELDPSGHLEPLLAPLNAEGASEFHAVLVTGPSSGIGGVAELAGRRVALPSARSWSGNWLANSGLAHVGLDTADLAEIHHFDHHQTVVWQVLRGNFDAGVVKESVAARYRSEGLVSLERSGPIPGPPLVGNRLAAPAALAEITDLLLAIDAKHPQDKALLDTWTSEFSHGFVKISMDHYRQAFGNAGKSP